jgi:anaerobic selenocysteine-containing dehydrogenase
MGAAATTVGAGWTTAALWPDQVAAGPGWTPGIEEWHNSACLVCPSRCGIRGRTVDGRLVSIAGNPLHPLSQGGICPRGIAGVQLLYHPDRLRTPLVRNGARGSGAWREISVEEALEQLATRLETLRVGSRPEQLAVLAGYCAGSMDDLWRQFLTAFGTPTLMVDAYADATAGVMGLMHGIPRPPAYDLEHSDFVLSFGAPLFESWWSPLQAFAAYAGRGEARARPSRYVQVDTRFSRTAAHAHEWAGVRPGTHAVLALGLAYVLLRDELFDPAFVAQHVTGFDDFTDARGTRHEGFRSLVMRRFRTEDVSAVTGVPVARITALARAFGESQAPVAVLGSDVTHAPNGLLGGLAVHSLNVLVGRVNQPGGVLFGHEVPLAPLTKPFMDDAARAGLRTRAIPEGGPPHGDGDRALRFAETVADAAESPIDTLLVYYANPLASTSRPDTWRRALDRLPFVVSFSPFMDETARYADLVIPDLLPYERWQDAPAPASYPYPVWALARPLVTPPTTTVPTADALLALAARLGGAVARSLPYADMEALLQSRARGLFEARRGMLLGGRFEREHHRAMEARGWWLPEHSEFSAFWTDLVERGGWTDLFSAGATLARTRSGRIELMPPDLEQTLADVGSTSAPYIDVATVGSEPDAEFPLRLLPYRVSTLASGTLGLQRWLAERPGLFPEVHWTPWVEVAPTTAEGLGMADATPVWVISRRGRYRALLKRFPGTAPENVCAPYGLRHPDGELANPLALLDGTRDPLTGLPAWSTTFVRLERA